MPGILLPKFYLGQGIPVQVFGGFFNTQNFHRSNSNVMNKNLRINLILTSMICCLFPSLLLAQMPEVISVREVGIKEGVDTEMLEKLAKMSAKQLAEKSDGMYFGFLKGNRGERSGEYLHSYAFQTQAKRDHYFPEENADPPKHTHDLFNSIELPEGQNPEDMLTGGEVFTDYVVLGYDKLEAPKGGAVVSIHKMEVAEADQAAFEKLVIESIHPAWQTNMPGLFVYVLKGDRGARKGQYVQMMVFDTMERRDAYFPKEGEGFAEEFADKITVEMNPTEAMSKLSVKSTGYTDYHFVNMP